MYILKRSDSSLIQVESIFFTIFSDFLRFFCTTLRLGTEVNPSPSFLGNVGYQSTHLTPILVDFGQPMRAQNGRNRYPTLAGDFRGPVCALTETCGLHVLRAIPGRAPAQLHASCVAFAAFRFLQASSSRFRFLSSFAFVFISVFTECFYFTSTKIHTVFFLRLRVQYRTF